MVSSLFPAQAVCLDVLVGRIEIVASERSDIEVSVDSCDEPYFLSMARDGMLVVKNSPIISERTAMMSGSRDPERYQLTLCRTPHSGSGGIRIGGITIIKNLTIGNVSVGNGAAVSGSDCITIDHQPLVTVRVPRFTDLNIVASEYITVTGEVGHVSLTTTEDLAGTIEYAQSVTGTIDDVALSIGVVAGPLQVSLVSDGTFDVGSVSGPVVIDNRDDTTVTIQRQLGGSLQIGVSGDGHVSVAEGTFDKVTVTSGDDGDISIGGTIIGSLAATLSGDGSLAFCGPVGGDVTLTNSDDGTMKLVGDISGKCDVRLSGDGGVHIIGSVRGNVLFFTKDDGPILLEGSVTGNLAMMTEGDASITVNGSVGGALKVIVTDDGDVSMCGPIGLDVIALTSGDGTITLDCTTFGGSIDATVKDDGDIKTSGHVTGSYTATRKTSYGKIIHKGDVAGEVTGTLVRR